MSKKFKVPQRKQPVWKPISKIVKLFYKKPEIINLNETLPQGAVMVANHAAMNGPLIYELHLPVFHDTWGAHQMMGSYSERFHYLRDVYFIQKRGMKKFGATLIAGFEALFSIYFYRGIKTLPTYTDGRIASTIKNSVTCLENDVSIMVFPENSSDGYHEVLTEFFPGFVSVAERFRKMHGKDVDIYPLYYSKKHNKIVIGRPKTLADFHDKDRRAIAEEFRKEVNALFLKYIHPQCEQPA